MAILFYCGRLSSAQLDRWQAPTQWPIIDRHPVRPPKLSVKTSADPRLKNRLRIYTASDENWLKLSQNKFMVGPALNLFWLLTTVKPCF